MNKIFKVIRDRRAYLIAGTFVLLATSSTALIQTRPGQDSHSISKSESLVAAEVEEEFLPPHREPPPPPLPPPPPPPPPPKPKPAKAARPPLPAGADVFRGLGAWVDVYDYAIRDKMDPIEAVDEMSRRGVKTLYLQTGRWKEPDDIVNVEKVTLFLDRASAKGIAVVGWYLPGFGDMERDIRRSLAVLQFRTPSGSKFSALAPDIETREEVSGDRLRFNAGVEEYSQRLREAVSPGTVLAGIVVDAKNNERAPNRWSGFPWQAIGRYYDIVMPMAYWTAVKGGACLGAEVDTAQYMRDVVAKTEALMGVQKPMHLIGGVADCITVGETAGYVGAAKQLGSLGVSVYDFGVTQSNPQRDSIWAELSKF